MIKKAQLGLAIEIGAAQRAVQRHFGRRPARMLDAGCGRVRPSGLLAEHVTGIDPDADALADNPCVDERILLPLEDVELEDEAFDLVVCWNVLEHLAEPIATFTRLVRAVRPGGLVVVALPNVQSLRGMVTKFTPTWFHILVFRVGFGSSPSDPDPYKTHLAWSLRRTKLLETCEQLGLRVVHQSRFEGYHETRLRELRPVLGRVWKVMALGAERLTFGFLSHQTDMIFVLARQDPLEDGQIRAD